MTENNSNWFECLGRRVPYDARADAVEEAREMHVELTEDEMFSWIESICYNIENDNPEGAMIEVRKHLDLTGAYRLLAVLCTGW